MLMIIYYEIRMPRGFGVVILSLLGIFDFIIIALICRKILSHSYTVIFDNENINVQSKKKNILIAYKEIEKIVFWNNSDYSKMIIKAKNEEIKLYVGFANLLKNVRILPSRNYLDDIFIQKLRFETKNYTEKDKEIIEYYKK